MRDDTREIKTAHVKVKENVRQGELDVADLAADIREHGLLQPILVRRSGEGYELILGHRRLAACKSLGMQSVPAVVTDGHNCSRLDLQLAENIQRKDLTHYEVGLALRRMRDHVDSIWDLARRVHRSYPWVTNHLEYADLYDDLRVAGVEEKLLQRVALDSLLEFKALEPRERVTAIQDIIPADPAVAVPTRAKIRRILTPRRERPREKRKKALVFRIHRHGLVLTLEMETKLDVRRVLQLLLERGGRLA